MKCPCGSSLDYRLCCEPFHLGLTNAPTAVALMKSRYSAYALKKIDYLLDTAVIAGDKNQERKDITEWANATQWIGLKILRSEETIVEFIADFIYQGKHHQHHEISKFEKIKGRWYFVNAVS